MSTEYRRLKPPFTSARLTPAGKYTQLTLKVNHRIVGYLALRNDEVPEALITLSRDNAAVSRHAAGAGKTYLKFYEDCIEQNTTLISEYGELTCLAEMTRPEN